MESLFRRGMLPVALGFTIKLEEVCEESARLELTADEAPPKGRIAKKIRKVSLRGQKRNQVSGP